MTKMKIGFSGKLEVKAIHENGSTVILDAPKDVGGVGKYFSPSDFIGAGVASCMLITMEMAAEKLGFDLSGGTVEVEKIMTSVPSRRIGTLVLRFRFPKLPALEVKEKLEKAALHCPVHASLHPEIKQEIEFVWGI